jgi:hypothetical protein
MVAFLTPDGSTVDGGGMAIMMVAIKQLVR